MKNWREVLLKLSWAQLTPESLLGDFVTGEPLTWAQASKLLRSRGFEVFNNYYNPGSQAVEICMSDKLKDNIYNKISDEDTQKDFQNYVSQTIIKEREGMRPFVLLLTEFFKNRISPSSTFEHYYGATRWLVRFKIPFRDRYISTRSSLKVNCQIQQKLMEDDYGT